MYPQTTVVIQVQKSIVITATALAGTINHLLPCILALALVV